MKALHALSASFVLFACGTGSKESAPTLPTSGTLAAGPRANLPVENTSLAAVGLDPEAIDHSANACTDFYQFACGGWLAKTEIPADKSRYGRFTEIYERNEEQLHAILEEARTGTLSSPIGQKLGAFYGSCMDEAAVEKVGIRPIQPLLAAVKKVSNRKTLDQAVAVLHGHGIKVLFSLESTPDYADATKVIGNITQAGLGLPDRDYYLSEDERFATLRTEYVQHVAAMLQLGGMSKAAATQGAQDVMKIETEIAKASLTGEQRRDPKATYNRLDRPGVEKLVPGFSWADYFKALGIAGIQEINVESKTFLGRMQTLPDEVGPAAWRNYLTWHVLDSSAPRLGKKFVDQNFAMSQKLSGAKELPARWKRCVQATDQALGELLAQPYLDRNFGPGAKQGADAMVRGITEAFRSAVSDLAWMSTDTRGKALAKLDKMAHLVGYPDKWRAYEWKIQKDAYAENVLASRTFEVQRDLAKIGKPYDRSEWYMSPQTVNAYYNPLANQMVFPAGILQPPFFSEKASVAVNLGAMGMIVGHELTHGFDDSGAQFDGDGNLNDWWAEVDQRQFAERGECVSKQYASYEPIESLPLNGKLTLGENIADMGGVKLAFMAYRKMREGADKAVVADGFTEDQQFFLAVGQAWCDKVRDEEARRRVVTDPHSPARFRVIGSLTNLPAFADAFQCKADAEMAPKDRCEIW